MTKRNVGVVVIGRNEGERLRRCLISLPQVDARIYVDSGSTDGSQELARSLGFDVVDLDTTQGFTAARARNAGLQRLNQKTDVQFVQFVDGDCEVRDGWISSALRDFQNDTAVVFGRRRERFPDRNIYHRACDDEWNVPPGIVSSCGGDALFRVSALHSVGGYNPLMIAGEEPELCLRLREAGWNVISNGKEMTWHDVAIDRFDQWWRRAKRTGFGFAALIDLHREDADPSWRRLLWSAGAWSMVLTATMLMLVAAVVTANSWLGFATLFLFVILLAAISRTALRSRRRFNGIGDALRWSGLLYVSKLAQMHGFLSQRVARRRSLQPKIIEYK